MSENQITKIEAQLPSVFEGDAFEKIAAVSEMMANSSLIPDTLCKDANKRDLPIAKVQGNCFLVAEQAYRWGISPFAAVGSASVIHGRLMWEGKLVAAVIERNAGVRLSYKYSGEGDKRTVVVSGKYAGEDEPRTVTGDVKTWRTTGKNSPWDSPANWDRQLAYRGSREWARIHSPAILMGVVTIDEADYYRDDAEPRSVAKAQAKDPFAGSESANVETMKKAEPAEEAEPEQEPEKKPQPAPDKKTGVVTIQSVTVREGLGKNGSDMYVVAMKAGNRSSDATTFSKTVGEMAIANEGKEVRVTTEKSGQHVKLLSISDQPDNLF